MVYIHTCMDVVFSPITHVHVGTAKSLCESSWNSDIKGKMSHPFPMYVVLFFGYGVGHAENVRLRFIIKG